MIVDPAGRSEPCPRCRLVHGPDRSHPPILRWPLASTLEIATVKAIATRNLDERPIRLARRCSR
jgi:hypothetical protein